MGYFNPCLVNAKLNYCDVKLKLKLGILLKILYKGIWWVWHDKYIKKSEDGHTIDGFTIFKFLKGTSFWRTHARQHWSERH